MLLGAEPLVRLHRLELFAAPFTTRRFRTSLGELLQLGLADEEAKRLPFLE
jgi:hypothetical protein